MATLSSECRKQLERAVVKAREVAEDGARAALEALAVHHHEPWAHMSVAERALRQRLRVHARQVGDRLEARGAHSIAHLVHECAYEVWHGMLFARFLAENALLIEPESGVAVTLEDCKDLAQEQGLDRWALAARYAHRMLPQVFRPDHPVFEVQLAREHRARLERLLEDLPAEIFAASDALGWVYQFWQSKRKDEVNRAEVKIGADELPAVTQLFTEPYMVQFLLQNSLGAWWLDRHPDQPCPIDLTYLRSAPSCPVGEGQSELSPSLSRKLTPSPLAGEGRGEGADITLAVGKLSGWPDHLADFRLLDPCCGSGHFLLAALLMLVPLRMALEGCSAATAIDAVLRENLHGLELDPRCVGIAAFALALEAWRYPGAGGHRPLPRLNLACCGQPVAGKREQWLALAGGDPRLEAGMAALHDTFRNAPLLGSLIDPARSVAEDMLTAGFDELAPLLEHALAEHAGDAEWEETAIAARGLAEAARLLAARYHLVITNVPYLTRGKQCERLRKFAETHYPKAKNDLANVFLERCLELCMDSPRRLEEARMDSSRLRREAHTNFPLPLGEGSREREYGVTQIVMPQNWLFLTSYKAQREDLLERVRWDLLARLGPGAFDTISGEVVNVILLTLSRTPPVAGDRLVGLDASAPRTAVRKAERLHGGEVVAVEQLGQLGNPDARVGFDLTTGNFLHAFATASQGIPTSDSPLFVQYFWEQPVRTFEWDFHQSTVEQTKHWGGCERLVLYEQGIGRMRELAAAQSRDRGRDRQGAAAWGRRGVAVGLMGDLPAALYVGAKFDNNVSALTPRNEEHVNAIWCYCSSSEFREAVRRIDTKLNVTNATLGKVPFDLSHWQHVAAERYPNGLPEPYSDDPTQWIFHGHPRQAKSPLQVAVARLLGYHWPAENDAEMQLAEEARALVERTRALHAFEDADGIVCLSPIRGEAPAHERLLRLLESAWGEAWTLEVLARLLADAGAGDLDDWLRNQFFEQHCKLFHHRPFVWHVWDGRRRDGFHALVNYHKLAAGDGQGRRLLEALTYSYLGDWIARQQEGVKRDEDGAEGRLAAAQALQQRLVAILAGVPPFDLFVRWKLLAEQPVGWAPDINDGVRLNIRPFMAADILGGKAGAGVLRAKPNIHWRKDRGKEPAREQADYPWFWRNGKFTGERVNDVHLSVAEKLAARECASGTGAKRASRGSV